VSNSAESTLKSDLGRNMKALAAKIEGGRITGDVAGHLRDTLWPFLEAVVDEVVQLREEHDEMGEAVDSLIEGGDDQLHEDTATKILTCVGAGIGIAEKFKERLDPNNPDDAELLSNIAAYHMVAQEVAALVDDITIRDGDADDGDDDESDGDDPGDDEEADDDEEDSDD
jgi:hypothetical protein